MRFYIIFLLLLMSLVVLSSFLIISLNTDIIVIDFLFTELHVELGKALLFFALGGFLVAFLLELLGKLSKKKLIN